MKNVISVLTLILVVAAAGTASAQEIDLIDRAGQARWSNSDGVSLVFGEEGRELGSARFEENVRLEDGRDYVKALYTHPQWKTRGTIIGSFSDIVIPAGGGKLIMAGGFLEGADESDGAIFTVNFVRTDVRQRSSQGGARGLMLCTFQARYDGRLDRKECDLSRVAGQTGEILLQVSSGINPNSDWAVWTEAKLVFGESVQAARQIVRPQPQESEPSSQGASGEARMVNALKGHNSPIDSVTVSPNGQFLLTVDTGGEAKVWQIPGGRVLNTLRGAGMSASPVFGLDSRVLAVCRTNGEVDIIDTAGGDVVRSLRGHSGAVNAAVFSSNGRMLLTAGQDGTAKVWDLRSGEEILSINHSDRRGIAVRAATFTPDDRHVITVGDDAAARIWEIQIK